MDISTYRSLAEQFDLETAVDPTWAEAQYISLLTRALYCGTLKRLWRQTPYTGAQPDYTLYYVLGAQEELGELIDKARRNAPADTLTAEAGDLLWYIFRLFDNLGVNVENALAANITKLSGRQKRGTIKGKGDDR